MKEKVLQAIRQFSMIGQQRKVVVALSGGADSISLLYVLNSLKDELGIEISAAHLNHMIRGEEALRDERFVRSECEKLGIELFCEQIDVPSYAFSNKMSIELAAREIRYDFLKRVNTGVVATAHTASDNLETMIYNLTRGASLKGICGIPPKRDIYIRPLIMCTREDVEEYCNVNHLSYVTDSTNLSDEYTRNRIRHNVIPVLKTINPSVEITTLRTAFLLENDENYLSGKSKEYLNKNVDDGILDVSELKSIDKCIAYRIIKDYVNTFYVEITLDNRHISDIYSICCKGGRVSLPKKMTAQVRKNKLVINRQSSKEFIVQISEENINFSENSKKVNNLFLKNAIDCDKIVGKSVIRTRLPGDSIRLANRGCTKTLKKLYNEYNFSVEERKNIPLIADDNGVIWINDIGVADRCCVTKNTKKILVVSVESKYKNMD